MDRLQRCASWTGDLPLATHYDIVLAAHRAPHRFATLRSDAMRERDGGDAAGLRHEHLREKSRMVYR